MKTIHINFGQFKGCRELLMEINPKFSKVGVLITAEPGRGKSALACALGLEDMTFKRIYEYKDACKKIEYLIRTRGIGLEFPLEKHLVYCAGFTIRTKASRMKSYDFDPFRVGLHDNNFQTQYFEKHALRIFDEMGSYYNSRDTSRFPNRVSSEFQKNRHYDIYNIGTAQEGMDVEIKLRRLFHFIEVLDVRTKKTTKGRVEKTIWTCNYLGNHKNWEKYQDSKCDESYIIARVIFEFPDNIFNYYDESSCEEEFDEISNSYSSHRSEHVINSVNAPPGYYKKDEKTKKTKEN